MFAIYEDDQENVPPPTKPNQPRQALGAVKPAREALGGVSHGGTIEAAKSGTPGRSALSFRQQVRRYEEKIRSYDGDDPLSPWIDYIACLQSHVSEGTADARLLVQVLEQCATRFQDTPQYANSFKYLKVWIAYADCSDDPLAILQHVAEKGIGSKLALLYQAYALVLERQDDLELAKKAYEMGLEVGAEPVERLEASYQDFLARMQQVQQAQQQVQQAAVQPVQRTQPAQAVDQVPVGFDRSITTGPRGEDVSFEEYRAQLRRERRRRQQQQQQQQRQKPVEQRPARRALGALPREPEPEHVVATAAPVGPGEVYEDDAMTAPEPTVNTKEALRDVMSMFSDSPGATLTPSAAPYAPVEFEPTMNLTTADLGGGFPVFEDDPTTTTSQLLPILETSREMNDSMTASSLSSYSSGGFSGSGVTTRTEKLVDPFCAKKRRALVATSGTLQLSHVEDLNGEELPFDVDDLLASGSGDIELGENFLHVDSCARGLFANCPFLVTMQAEDLDAEDEADAAVTVSVGGKQVPSASSPSAAAALLWELFIAHELSRRVRSAASRQQLLLPRKAFTYANGTFTCVLSPQLEQNASLGTLLSAYARRGKSMPEPLAAFYTIEMLRAVEVLHGAEVVHAALEPSSFVVRQDETQADSVTWGAWTPDRRQGWQGKGLAVRNFSNAIDLTQFERQTQFVLSQYAEAAPSSSTTCCTCVSIHRGQCWTTQVDSFAVANIAHQLLGGGELNARMLAASSNSRITISLPAACESSPAIAATWRHALELLINDHGDVSTLTEARQLLEQSLAKRSSRGAAAVKVLLCEQNIMLASS